MSRHLINWHLLVQSQQWKHQINRETCLYSGVFIVNFEHILHTIDYEQIPVGYEAFMFFSKQRKRDENVAFSLCGRSNEYQALIETLWLKVRLFKTLFIRSLSPAF